MDIAITKKRTAPMQRMLWLLLIIPLVFAIKYLLPILQTDFSVNKDSIVVDEVKQGKYAVSVRGTGLLVPENIQWLSANVEATVVKRVVKAGNIVKTGDLIVKLDNPQLVQGLAEAKWEFEAMSEEFKAASVTGESALQQQKANVLNVKLEYERSQLEYNAHNQLIKTGAVSKLAFERARLTMDQFKQRLSSSQEEFEKLQESLVAQKNARTARLNQKRKMIERIQQQVDDLEVKATMDSIVLEVPLEEGQRIAMGTNIAKLAQQDSLIAELQVPEIQIRDVSVGKKVVIDTRNNKIEGVVSRIDPAVINGNVQVDVTFTDELPDDARPDLSVDGEIKIIDIPNALYVKRPLFTQSRSNTALYIVSENEQYAERTEVVVGYGSVNEIQILEGLKVGDKVITSDPTRFETYNKFRIN